MDYFDVMTGVVDGTGRPNARLKRLDQCLTHAVHEGPESRGHQRFAVVTRVQTIALTSDMRLFGPQVEALTVNVSVGGLAILSTHEIAEPYLAVDFSAATNALKPVILKKLRSEATVRDHLYAGEFLSRMDY